MRLVFLGTPEFAVPTLERIVEAGHEVAAVFTQPDRPKGRGQAARRAARERGRVAARTSASSSRSESARPKFWRCCASFGADAMVVVGYGKIIPQADHRSAAPWHHQRARFAAAEVSRRRADSMGHRQRRDTHRRHHHADRRRPRHRRHAAADARRKSAQTRPRLNWAHGSRRWAPNCWSKRSRACSAARFSRASRTSPPATLRADPQKRRRPHRLEPARRRRFTTACADSCPGPAATRCLRGKTLEDLEVACGRARRRSAWRACARRRRLLVVRGARHRARTGRGAARRQEANERRRFPERHSSGAK